MGHKGKFGHEFLEFEFRPDGKMNQVAFYKLKVLVFTFSFVVLRNIDTNILHAKLKT